jgi:hypothetical protein
MNDDDTRPSPGLVTAAERFATVRGHASLIYFLSPDEPIGTSNVQEVARCVGDRRFEELDLVIDSVGGDIHAAYQLVSFLRQRAERLIACVPRYARSAATLLCVGADLIILDELAALGPLDAQVYEGSTELGQKYSSALNPFKALERLRAFSLETLQDAAEILWASGVHRTDDVLKHAMEFVRVTAAPLFDKIETHRLGEFSQALAIGEEYGRRLLAQTASGLSEERREEIVSRLVHQYPSHEYVIDRAELQGLGLQAEAFTADERTAAKTLARHATERAVLLVDPSHEAPAPMKLPDLEDVEHGVGGSSSESGEVGDEAVEMGSRSHFGVAPRSRQEGNGPSNRASPNPWSRRRDRGRHWN